MAKRFPKSLVSPSVCKVVRFCQETPTNYISGERAPLTDHEYREIFEKFWKFCTNLQELQYHWVIGHKTNPKIPNNPENLCPMTLCPMTKGPFGLQICLYQVNRIKYGLTKTLNVCLMSTSCPRSNFCIWISVKTTILISKTFPKMISKDGSHIGCPVSSKVSEIEFSN